MDLPRLHVLTDELLGVQAFHDLDTLHVLVDDTALGISGYQAAYWPPHRHPRHRRLTRPTRWFGVPVPGTRDP